ncbi:D-alanyl-D-alanine carboxypeptidase [Ruminococcaceae bacterium YRB3002]|nr:D-alanyl-D-alanine carboxypeptidase [Ruminococcaceae bacterium YRB3002]
MSIFRPEIRIRLAAAVIAVIETVCLLGAISATPVMAINEDLDDPNDDMVSQNEQKYDLLNENHDDWPKISASAYVLYDLDSGAVILGKDYDVQREPASTTKVMTLLLALENLDLDDVVTISPEMALRIKEIPPDYVRLGLVEGEQITVRDLVYAGALKSANDACLVLAMHMGGTEELFCAMMNDKAKDIGCLNTHFSSSFGYANPDNLTTAYDLSLILGEAVRSTEFSKISTTYTYTVPATNKYSDSRPLNNANRFISSTEFSYDYYIGGKTGFTDSAGYTLVGAARKNDHTLVACVLNAADSGIRYVDLKNMFEYGFSHYTTVAISPTEFDSAITQTNSQINDLLVNTKLYIDSQQYACSDYLTVPSSRASLGSTNVVELSNVMIDTTLSEQTIKVPLCKVYSDGKKYIVGVLTLQINTKSPTIEINPEKETGYTKIKPILIAVAVISLLILILVISLVALRHSILKKKRDETNRARML